MTSFDVQAEAAGCSWAPRAHREACPRGHGVHVGWTAPNGAGPAYVPHGVLTQASPFSLLFTLPQPGGFRPGLHCCFGLQPEKRPGRQRGKARRGRPPGGTSWCAGSGTRRPRPPVRADTPVFSCRLRQWRPWPSASKFNLLNSEPRRCLPSEVTICPRKRPHVSPSKLSAERRLVRAALRNARLCHEGRSFAVASTCGSPCGCGGHCRTLVLRAERSAWPSCPPCCFGGICAAPLPASIQRCGCV